MLCLLVCCDFCWVYLLVLFAGLLSLFLGFGLLVVFVGLLSLFLSVCLLVVSVGLPSLLMGFEYGCVC